MRSVEEHWILGKLTAKREEPKFGTGLIGLLRSTGEKIYQIKSPACSNECDTPRVLDVKHMLVTCAQAIK